MLGQLLSDVLFLSGPLYPAYAGPRAVGEQQLAGLVMMVEQTLALGLFAALVLRSEILARPSRRRSARLAATA